jgi:hypothetical protein
MKHPDPKPVRRPSSSASTLVRLAAAISVAALLGAAPALAGSYYGYGDTGWDFYDKRECCEEAVWLAQENSMQLCENAGGEPKVPSGSTRGLCDTDSRGSGRDRIYRCTAKANVYCR